MTCVEMRLDCVFFDVLILRDANSQCNWRGGGLYDRLITRQITLALTMNRIYIRALEIMRKVATSTLWIY